MKVGFKRGAPSGQLYWCSGAGSDYEDPGESIKLSWDQAKGHVCAERTWGTWDAKPCSRPAKHDPDRKGNPTRCGHHCKAAVEKREAKKTARWSAWERERRAMLEISKAEQAMGPALRTIANGHNDPRTLAREIIEKFDAGHAALKAAKESKP